MDTEIPIQSIQWSPLDDVKSSAPEQLPDLFLSDMGVLESRACRALMLADSFVNCRQISHNLTSFFSECGIMCSFDIFSNETLLQRVITSSQYDIIFISKELVIDSSFRDKFLASFNAATPLVVYVNDRRTKSKSCSYSILHLTSSNNAFSINSL